MWLGVGLWFVFEAFDSLWKMQDAKWPGPSWSELFMGSQSVLGLELALG